MYMGSIQEKARVADDGDGKLSFAQQIMTGFTTKMMMMHVQPWETLGTLKGGLGMLRIVFFRIMLCHD